MDKVVIKNVVEKLNIKFTETLRVNASFMLGYDEENGKLSLLGKDGAILSQVDLPIEKILTNAFYDDTTKELVLDFESANQVRIPIDFTDEIEKAINEFETQVNERFSNLEQSIQENNEQTNQKISQLETNVNQVINEQLTEVNSKIDTLEENVNKVIEEELTLVNETIDKLEENINNVINEQLEVVNKEIEDLQTSLDENVEQLNQKVDTLEDTINNNIGIQVETLNNSINETKQDLQGYKESNAQSLSDLETNLEQKIVENVEQINSDIEEINNNKVDKVDGKQLSTIDLTNELLALLQDKYTKAEIDGLDSALQQQIDEIKLILTTDDVDFDTLQELVNALKNNVASINDIFTELSKKANKTYVDEELGKKVKNEDFETYKESIDLRFEDIEPQGIIDVATKDDINLKRGTIVPKDKVFNTVYLNTSLKTEQVRNILSKLSYRNGSELGYSSLYYYLIYNITGSGGYKMMAFKNYNGSHYAIGFVDGDSTSNRFNLLFSTTANFYSDFYYNDFVGWETNFNGIKDNIKGSENFYAYPTNYQNEKLINLVSITPFKDPNEQVLYRVPTNVVGVYDFYWIKNNTRYKMVSNSDVNNIETDLREAKNTINGHTTQIENLNTDFNNFVNESEMFAEEINEKLSSIQPDAIVDVKSVKEITKYQGTPIPNGGSDVYFTGNIYFNTALSIDEVKQRLSKLLYSNYEGTLFCYVAFGIGLSITIMTADGEYLIFLDGEPIFTTSNFGGEISFVGWYPLIGIADLSYNDVNLSKITVYQNEMISDVISITPFEKPSENVLYRIDESNAIPNNSYVENIYINTSLSEQEVINIVSKIDLSQIYYFVLADEETFSILAIVGFGTEFVIMGSIGGNELIPIFSTSEEMSAELELGVIWKGWYEPLIGDESVLEIPVNLQLKPTFDGLKVGTQNELLTKLFSTSPEFKESTNKELEIYQVKNGKTYQVNKNAIIEVDELPKVSGTTVPNEGYVENVYFNTDLSIEEVKSIIDKVVIQIDEDEAGYFVLNNALSFPETEEEFLQFRYIQIIKNLITNLYCIQFADSILFAYCDGVTEVGEYGFSGWNLDFVNPYNVNSIVYDNFISAFEVGKNNDKLVNLFSTTPFTNSNIDKNSFYKVVEKEIASTPVPTSGLIEKIYFNTNLSHNEVVEICESLNYVEYSGYIVCPIFTDSTMTNHLSIVKQSSEGTNVYVIALNLEGEETDYFMGINNDYNSLPEDFKRVLGWSHTEPAEINLETALSTIAPMVNFEPVNDKVKKLFSITPNFEEKIVDEKIYYNLKDEWVELGSGSSSDNTFSGSYNDLTDKPDIPTKTSQLENDSNFATTNQLFNKDYNELNNKPTIPSDTSELTNSAGYITNSALNGYAKQSELPTKVSELENDKNYLTQHQDISNKADISYVNQKVADLVNSAPETLDTLGEVAKAIQDNASVVEALNSAIGNKADKSSLKALAYKDSLSKADVGLGNVSNVESYSKTETDTLINSTKLEALELTWSELKSLRDNSQLIKGREYIITDYTLIPNTSYSMSGYHQFDIIVVADSVNTLNENARARKHVGDTYFANSNLSNWQLKYCLDNDRTKYSWASDNGYGVIYWLKDEFNNECPYDFKNVLFHKNMVYKYSELNLTQNVYTFSKITDGVLTDASLTKDGKTYNNKIKTSFRTDGYQQVPQEIVFINCDRCNNNELIDCYKLTFGYVTKDSYSAEAVRNKLIDCSYSYFNNINSSTMYICTDIYVEKVLYGCYAFNSSYIKKTDSWTYKLEIEKVRGKSSNYITIPSIGVTYNNISHVLRLETTYDNKIILKWKTGTGTEVGKYLDSNADTEWKDIPSSSVLYKHFITAYVGSDKTIYFTLYSSSKTEMTKQYLQNTFNTKEPIHCWCDDTDWGYQYNCIMIKDFYQVDGNFHLEMIQMTDDETPHRNGWTFKFTDSVCTVTDVVTPM